MTNTERLDKIANINDMYNGAVIRYYQKESAEIAKNYDMGLITPHEYTGQIGALTDHTWGNLRPHKECVPQDILKKIIDEENARD